MKKFIVIALIVAGSVQSIHAQWTTSGSTALYTGNIGLGYAGIPAPPPYTYAGPAQYGAIEFPRGEILFSNTNPQNQLYLMTNAYMNSAGGFSPRTAGVASSGLGMDGGSFFFFTSPTNGPFSLTPKMIIGNNGDVGIGISPSARFEVHNSDPLGTSTGNSLLLTKTSGIGNVNYFMNNTWLRRYTGGGNWQTASLHDGISIDNSYLNPGTDTRTWWERYPFEDIQSWGTTGQAYMTINAGKVGIGTTTPTYKLHVKSPDYQLVAQSDGTGNNRGIIGFADPAGVKGSIGLFGSDQTIRIGDATDYRIVLKQGGNVGIGLTNPSAKLDILTTQNLGLYKGNNFLMTRNAASGNANYIMNNTWLVRHRDDPTGGDWLSASIHDGISIASSYLTPGVDTRTWYERAPFEDIQRWGTSASTYMTIRVGNVGIGTETPDAKLAVKGTIHANEVKVDLLGAISPPDYVFEKSYTLPTLTEVKSYIDENKHLPEIPSAKEMEKNGLNLGEMNMLLLKKVEELTLYVIELEKKVNSIEKKN